MAVGEQTATQTAFVLVPGLHTGGWIWQEVAERLRASGARAYPLTLSGMDGKGEGEGADLGTHVADVLRAVRGTDAERVVLVGHCYGVHPVLGAADRLPDRVARIVLLDTPMPRDGDPAAALVPDQALREGLLDRIAADGPAPAAVPAPASAQEWAALGSLAGLGDEERERLVRRGVAQPWGTLARPLGLGGNAGADGGVPVTGVLCAGNGSSLATVEGALALGDPRFAYLAAPHLSYLEMATGHWPMLSEPDATAGVLLRAAAGEGAVPGRPEEAGPPAHLRPFLLDVPGRPRERRGRVDFHLPEGDGPHPAVVLVHGGPVPEGAEPTPREWPGFVGYARLLAGRGAVGAVVDHRLHGLGDFDRAAGDVAEAVAAVRADPRVDADRIALWFFSVGGLLSADWLAAPPPWLRCLALTYPLLAPLPAWGVSGPRFRPAAAVRGAGRLPVVLTRVGRERPEFAATVEDFRAAAGTAGVDVHLIDVPSAVHGFETPDHSGEARAAVRGAVDAVLARL
ncbi:alpha/beta fold hydrolase [Streptomyces sp. NPDC020983]|uniref:alpha/beta fold hydrolase n=1 Tax=Streptomyces sp. NPDC020983 TaxID=3365106 RepID=UPI00378A6958